MFFRILVILVAAIAISINSYAQINIERGKSVKSLIQNNFSSDSITISNVRFKGSRRAIGQFKDQGTVKMHKGILLSTGSAKRAMGPNKSDNQSGFNFSKGDKTLSKLAKAKTHDAVIIEFDFVPKCSFVSFNYVFASEEYPEFAGSGFNDVFAFLLSRRKHKAKNLAHIPHQNKPIAINTVNHKMNQQYYVNNAFLYDKPTLVSIDTNVVIKNNKKITTTITYNIGAALISKPTHNIEFDGYTKVLQAKSNVIPGVKYHLKIAIADASDRMYDSGVFIEHGSFHSHKEEDYKFGTLANVRDYYFKIDTISVEPLIPLVKMKEVFDTIVASTIVHFKAEEYHIGAEQLDSIRTLFEIIKPNEIVDVQIKGYTDQSGAADLNKVLSKKRAYAVAKNIHAKGVSKSRFSKVKGYGSSHSTASNNTKNGRAENRRTEVKITAIQSRMVPDLDETALNSDSKE